MIYERRTFDCLAGSMTSISFGQLDGTLDPEIMKVPNVYLLIRYITSGKEWEG